jgi:hypothetical protein
LFVTGFAAQACAVSLSELRRFPNSFPQAARSGIGGVVVWGGLLAGGFLVHPAVTIGLAPWALAHILRKNLIALKSSRRYERSLAFLRLTLMSPESWATLRFAERHAISEGVFLHPCIDLVLAKAERREARDPSSSFDIGPRPPSLF